MKLLKRIALIVAAIVLVSSCAYAAVSYSDKEQSLGNDRWAIDTDGHLEHQSASYGITMDSVTKEDWAIERPVQFNTQDLLVENDGTPAPLTTSTAPGLEEDNDVTSVVWADGETTPVRVEFRVPADYKSGGAFRAFCDESDSTTPNEVDFQVFVNSDGSAWDSSPTDQTPVALAGTAGTPDMVTLSVATDFSALSAGDVATLELWRDDTADGTGDLELYYLEFFYTANQD